MSEWWQMGGYAAYVWSSYGIAFAVLAANVVWPYWRQRTLRARLKEADSS